MYNLFHIFKIQFFSVVQIIADYANQTAIITQCGPNSSEVDNKLLVQQETVEVSDGSSINLLEGDLKFTLEFLKDAVHIGSKQKYSKSSSPEKSHKRIKVLSELVSSTETDSHNEEASSAVCRSSQSMECEASSEGKVETIF